MVTQTDRSEGLVGNLGMKAPVTVASTTNLVLSATQTIDGIAVVAEDRVLAKDQTDGTENGIYTVQASAWVRAPDWDGNKDVVQGTVVFVSQGTVSAGLAYQITTANTITIGTTSITFAATPTLSTTPFIDTLLDDTTATVARTTLGLGDMAVQNKASVNIDGGTIDGVTIVGGSITGMTDIAIADGGTGAGTAAAAFTALKQAASDTATGVLEIAVQSEMESASSTILAVTPGRLHYHPAVPKVVVAFGVTGNILGTAFNMTSVTDTGTGDALITFNTDFADENWVGIVSTEITLGYPNMTSNTIAVGSVAVRNYVETVTLTDPITQWSFVAWGDQA